MTTTSLKLSPELKQRAAAVALQQGMSAHAFMVDAIAQAANMAEQRGHMVDAALDARAQALQSGQSFDADAVHAYLKARVVDKNATRPQATSWRK